jgi:hypothetical protein
MPVYCTYQGEQPHYIPFTSNLQKVDVSTQLCHSMHRIAEQDTQSPSNSKEMAEQHIINMVALVPYSQIHGEMH